MATATEREDDEQPGFDVERIRQLMLAAFTCEELRLFCQDRSEFQRVAVSFDARQSHREMVDLLVAHCQQHDLLGLLLVELREYGSRRRAKRANEPRIWLAKRIAELKQQLDEINQRDQESAERSEELELEKQLQQLHMQATTLSQNLQGLEQSLGKRNDQLHGELQRLAQQIESLTEHDYDRRDQLEQISGAIESLRATFGPQVQESERTSVSSLVAAAEGLYEHKQGLAEALGQLDQQIKTLKQYNRKRADRSERFPQAAQPALVTLGEPFFFILSLGLGVLLGFVLMWGLAFLFGSRLFPLRPIVIGVTATPTATDAGVSTLLPEPAVVVTGLSVEYEVQPDGTLKRTAYLSVGDLGYGKLEIIAPSVLGFGQSGLIQLKITPDSALGKFLPVTVDLESATNSQYGIYVSDRVQIYPVMIAELHGLAFDIAPTGPQKQVVTSASQAVWSWSVSPKWPISDEQYLFLTVSIPVLLDQTVEQVGTTLKEIPIQVRVEVTPLPTGSPTPTHTPTPTPTFTPTPTPTPKPLPLPQRLGDSLVTNFAGIVVGIIALIGVLVTAYASIRNSKRSSSIKDLAIKLEADKSKEERQRLEQEIAHLKSIKWWQFWRR